MSRTYFNRTNHLSFAFIFFIALGTPWCATKQHLAPPPISNSNYLPVSPSIITDFYLDGTLSMQGFVGEGVLTTYQQTILLLERPIIENNGTAKFYKFGTAIRPLVDRTYREADKKAFYSDGSLNTKTLIQDVITGANSSHLTVVLTDLFQEQSDIELLNKLIKEKYLDKGLAVGVLSINSQFNGKIYDVGTHNYSFSYPTTADAAGTRPFYIIALGRPSDIARYYDGLRKSELATLTTTNAIVFSRFLTDKYESFQDAEVTDLNGLNDLSGSKVIVDGDIRSGNFKEFKIKSGSARKFFSAKMPFTRLRDTVEFKDLHANVSRYQCSDSGAAPQESNSSAVSQPPSVSAASPPNTDTKQNTSPAIEISSNLIVEESASGPQVNAISVNIGVNSELLTKGSVDCYHIVLNPVHYELPLWVRKSNMNGRQVEEWRKDPNSFDGTKTYNLEPFLETLMRSSTEIRPTVADFYCYFSFK